ncbi:uncharacterized protein [Rutidosis leptorrhynchoides]|uniref:uncharacterized protein n=1 Tax=Rutidosis leptorrhynchoides TaxID=125765 RepID=UPI003A9A2EA8
MAKSNRGRRRIASRHCRITPYSTYTCQHVSRDPHNKKSSIVMPKKDWEDIMCSVCMEYPHNAVLLLCSSHDKGCRPYMCGTSSRYSNCLDQYKKAYTKVTSSPHHSHSLQTNTTPVFDQISGWPVEKCGEGSDLSCPLCRGKVKGWTVVESAREYLNGKKRTCMHEDCSFVGGYKDLRKHVRSEHHSTNPHEVDPDLEQRWSRFERERERDDVISTITSSIPGSMVFGDYVIETNDPYGIDSDNEDGFETGLNMGIDGDLVNMLLLFHAFGSGGGIRRRNGVGGRISDDDDDDDDGNGDDNNGMSLVNRLHRQGRVLLGRSGRRRRDRVVNRGQSQT